MNEIEQKQNDIDKEVNVLIGKNEEKIQIALTKAQSDRQKAIKELNEL
jgi:hypothetical protein